jgi:hypothetical protein
MKELYQERCTDVTAQCDPKSVSKSLVSLRLGHLTPKSGDAEVCRAAGSYKCTDVSEVRSASIIRAMRYAGSKDL